MTRSLALAAVLAACHPAAPAAAPRALATVAALDTSPVRAVVELDGNAYVFESTGVSVVRAGTVIAHTELGVPERPSTIAALGGDGRWVVSGLRRIMPDGEVGVLAEERLGLSPHVHWSGVYGAGPTIVATSSQHLAIATDGHHVALYPPTTAHELAVARGRVALAGAAAIDVWDLAAGTSRAFPIGTAHVVFADANATASRLVAWTADKLAIEGRDGALHPIATPTPIAAVVASGSRVWVWAGARLAYLDRGATALVPTALDARQLAGIFGSPSGDVWVTTALAAHADKLHLARYALDAPAGDPAWSAAVAPVFAHVCARCHLPGGTAGIDLSTPATWRDARAEIRRRVLVAHSMPPAGTPPLTDADQSALAAWLDAP